MLDGHKAAAVIVGQNWGGAGEESQESPRDQQPQQQHHQEQAEFGGMVDMIQQQQQGPLEMRIPPLYPLFDRNHDQIQLQQQHSFLDHHQSWRGFPDPEQSSSSGIINCSSFHQLQQRRYQIVNYDNDEQELKMLFPSDNNFSQEHLHKKARIQIPHQQEKKSSKHLKDEVGEDLLSLRPPNSALSGVTTGSDHDHQSHQSHQSLQSGKAAEHADEFPPPPGLELLNLLLECAQAVNSEDLDAALGLLLQLKQGASVYGDSMQRLTAHFSDGLATRILRLIGRRVTPPQAEFLRSLVLGSGVRTAAGGAGGARTDAAGGASDYLGAFTALYTVSPFFKMAHFTANQAILEAFDGHDHVHVIDLDVMQGLQWPSFIQALASRRPRPPSMLRISGLGSDPDALRETGNRLASFATGFGVPFMFDAVAVPPGELPSEELLSELTTGKEVLAVNAIFQFHRLLGRPVGSPRGLERFLLGLRRRLSPRAVTMVEQEAAHNAPGFIARFMEALHYYAAVFDSLDATLPQRNEERVMIEQAMFARQIRNIVSCEGEERVERHERMDFWRGKMRECGFEQVPMSSHSLSQAKLLLQLCPCDGYRLAESPHDQESDQIGSISLGWQDRLLLTASSWACNPHF